VTLRGQAVAWARSYGLSTADAEDVAHAALETLLQKGAEVRRECVHAWLRTVVLHKAREHSRARREVLAETAEPVAEVPDPEDTLVSRQMTAQVRAALACIPPSRRDVVRLVAIDGRTLDEAAAAEGVPESTVRARLRDGTADLRGELSRRRAEERRKSGGFSSWLAAWGILDLRVWARRSLAALGAATLGGALTALTVSSEPVAAPQTPVAVAPVVLVEDAPLPDTREHREAPAASQPVVRERTRHDAGRRFRAERFGVE
jgi:RNA polymerase sigma-70 factor (ECF subfamily)